MTGFAGVAPRILLAFALVAAPGLAGCSGAPGSQSVVTVLGSWTGDEENGFLAMIAGFERRYGIQVEYTGTRDADAVLSSDLKDGNPPDLAVLATPVSCGRTPRRARSRRSTGRWTRAAWPASTAPAGCSSCRRPGRAAPGTTTRSSSRRP